MQARAIVRAAKAVADRSGEAPQLEIMIPLVAYEKELELMRELVLAGGRGGGRRRTSTCSIGTMIELPRACFVADRIAEQADFFSFGTNDLTQTALGFSRDDVEASFLARLHGEEDRGPQPVRDHRPARGRLARAAGGLDGPRGEARPQARRSAASTGGTRTRSRFFQLAGLDYVSCSPYRVPIARVAAAQAALDPE